MTLEQIYSEVGQPARDVGSGIHILQYVLSDGSLVFGPLDGDADTSKPSTAIRLERAGVEGGRGTAADHRAEVEEKCSWLAARSEGSTPENFCTNFQWSPEAGEFFGEVYLRHVPGKCPARSRRMRGAGSGGANLATMRVCGKRQLHARRRREADRSGVAGGRDGGETRARDEGVTG